MKLMTTILFASVWKGVNTQWWLMASSTCKNVYTFSLSYLLPLFTCVLATNFSTFDSSSKLCDDKCMGGVFSLTETKHSDVLPPSAN